MEFTGQITKEGKWVGFGNMRDYVARRFKGKSVSIDINEVRPKASKEAYSYYHAVIKTSIVWALAELGNDINPYDKKDQDVVHRFLCNTILKNGKDIVDANGEVHKTDSSIAGLTHDEICQFENDCIMWAGETLHISIPEPDKEWRKKGQLGFVFKMEQDYPEIAKKYQDKKR